MSAALMVISQRVPVAAVANNYNLFQIKLFHIPIIYNRVSIKHVIFDLSTPFLHAMEAFLGFKHV